MGFPPRLELNPFLINEGLLQDPQKYFFILLYYNIFGLNIGGVKPRPTVSEPYLLLRIPLFRNSVGFQSESIHAFSRTSSSAVSANENDSDYVPVNGCIALKPTLISEQRINLCCRPLPYNLRSGFLVECF